MTSGDPPPFSRSRNPNPADRVPGPTDAIGTPGTDTLIPAFLNPTSGTADPVATALETSKRFSLHRVEPAALAQSVRDAVRSGAARVLVAGGDGSIATAASVLAGTSVELAVAPAGTLNHFARDHDIPLEPAAAVALAATGSAHPVDVGYLGSQIFLNTSSLGAYVSFVRLREMVEHRWGYALASAFAAMRTFITMRALSLRIDTDTEQRHYRTNIAFIGVGERELRIPSLGARIPGGRSGLHIIIPRTSSRRRLLLVAGAAALRGGRGAVGSLRLDSFVVDHCTVAMRHARGHVAVDGEVIPAAAPLEYRIARGALHVVTEAATAASSSPPIPATFRT